MAGIGDVLVRIGVDISDFAKDLEGMQNEFEKLEQKFSETGKSLSLAISLPLAGIAGAALKTFGDFEATMNKVNALAGLTGDQFGKLKDQALDLGAKTQFSAKQAADAMAELAAAGFQAEEIYKAMPGTLALAAAGQLKLGDAAQIASAILKGFGFEAGKIGDIANVLAAAANASAASVQDLGSSFKYVGPVAAAVGVSFTETAAALSILANAGIKGEMGGTALRNMFSDLIAPSKQATVELAKLGIQVADASGKLLPMGDLIKNLAPLQTNLAAGFKIFGVRFSEVLPLLKAGSEQFGKLSDEMTKASQNKSAEVMASQLFKGWNAAVESFKGSMETTLIKIGDILAKPAGIIFKQFFEPLMNWLGELADAFSKLPMPIQTGVLALGAIAVAAGPVLFVMGQLMDTFASLKLLGPVLQGIGGYFTNLGAEIKVAGSALGQLFSAAQLKATGDAITGSIGGALSGALTSMKNFPAAASSAMSGFVSAVSSTIAAAGPKIVQTFSNLGPSMMAGLSSALAGASGMITGAIGSITAAFSGLSLAGVWSGLVSGLTAAGSAITGFLATAGSLTGVGALIVAAIVAIGGALYEVIKWWDQITAVMGAFLSDVAKAFLDWVGRAFGDSAKKNVEGFFGSMKNAVLGIPSAISGMWSALTEQMDKGMRFLVDKALGLAKALNLDSTAKALENWRNELDKSLNGAANGLANLSKQAGGVGPALAAGFNFKSVTDASKAIEGLHAQVTGVIDAVKTDITFYGAKNAQKDAEALKSTLGQLQQAFVAIENAQKAHLITDQEAAALKSKLAGEVQNVKGALANLEGQANRTGVAIETHSKTVDKAQKAYQSWKDKVQDMVEDLAKSWEEFQARVASGDNGQRSLKQMEEAFRDLGRTIEATVDKGIKEKLAGLQKDLGDHIAQYKQWSQAIADAKLAEQWQKVTAEVDKFRSIKAFENMKKDLEGILGSWKELENSAKTLGVDIGNVFDSSTMNVYEQEMQKVAQAYADIMGRAKELHLTTKQQEDATNALKAAYTNLQFAAVGGYGEIEKAAQRMGTNVVQAFDVGRVNVYEAALAQAQKDYDLLAKNADTLRLTEEQRVTIVQNLAKAQQDYALSAVGGYEKLMAAYETLNEKSSNATKAKWDKEVTDAQNAFNTISRYSDASNSQLYQAWLALQTKKVAAQRNALNEMEKDGADFGDAIEKETEVSMKEAVLAVNQGVENMKTNLGNGLKGIVSAAFEGDFKQVSKLFHGLVDQLQTDLINSFVKPFQDMFSKMIGNLTSMVANFVTDSLFGNLLGGLNKVFGGTGLSNLTELGTTMASTAKQTTAAVGGMAGMIESYNTAIDSATTGVKAGTSAVATAGVQLGKTANEVAGTASKAATSIANGFTGMVTAVSGVVSAVTGVLSYLQGRRMEQDIGRIEVTTRGILNQTISLQETLNKWLPYLNNLAGMGGGFAESLGPILGDALNPLYQLTLVLTGAMEATRDGMKVVGNELDIIAQMLGEVHTTLQRIQDATESFASGGGGTGGGDTGDLNTAMEESRQRMSALSEQFSSLNAAMESVGATTNSTVIPAVNTTNTALQTQTTAQQNATQAVQALNTTTQQVADTSKVASTQLSGASQNFGTVGTAATTAADSAKNSFSGLVINIKLFGEEVQQQTRGIFSKSLDGINQAVAGPAREVQKSFSGISIEIGNAAQKTTEATKEINKGFTSTWTAAGTMGVAVENGAVKLVDFTAEAQKAAKAAWDASGALDKVTDAEDGLIHASQVTNENIGKLVETLFTAPDTLKLTDAALQKVVSSSEYATRKLQDVGKSAEDLAAQAGVAWNGTKKLTEATGEFGTTAYKWGETVSSTSQQMAGAAATLGQAVETVAHTVESSSQTIAGAASSLGRVADITVTPVEQLAYGVQALGAGAAHAAGQIASAAGALAGPMPMPSSTSSPSNAHITSSFSSASSSSSSSATTAAKSFAPGEISWQDFAAKGYTAGIQGPNGGVIPYGPNGKPLTSGAGAGTGTGTGTGTSGGSGSVTPSPEAPASVSAMTAAISKMQELMKAQMAFQSLQDKMDAAKAGLASDPGYQDFLKKMDTITTMVDANKKLQEGLGLKLANLTLSGDATGAAAIQKQLSEAKSTGWDLQSAQDTYKKILDSYTQTAMGNLNTQVTAQQAVIDKITSGMTSISGLPEAFQKLMEDFGNGVISGGQALQQMMAQLQATSAASAAATTGGTPMGIPDLATQMKWGTPDQLWGQSIGSTGPSPTPSMNDTSGGIGINVAVNNADAADIADQIVQALHGAGY